MWNDKSLTLFQMRVILISAALEARSMVDGMQLAPHFIIKGEAGSGKTFLGNLLYTTKEASTLTTDSEGVGQLTLRIGHKVLKVNDAGQTTLTSKRMVDTFKTCYQNNWSAKEHGCRQDNTSTCIWITTNVKHPLTLMAFEGDVGPLKRRFLEIKVKNKKLELPKKGKINKKVVDDAIELTTELLLTQALLMEDQISNRIEDVSNTHIAKELKLVENELRWMKEIHLTSDSEEESSDEDIS